MKTATNKLIRAAALDNIRAGVNDLMRATAVLDRRDQIEKAPDIIRLAHAVRDLREVQKSLAGAKRNPLVSPRLAMVEADIERLRVDIYGALKSHARVVGSFECIVDSDRWARRILAQSGAPASRPATRPTVRRSVDAATARRKRVEVAATARLLRTKASDGRPLVVVTASSDATDLDGDAFSRRALDQMAGGMKGKLAFLNHRYSVPDDVFGTIEATKIEKRGASQQLDLTIGVELLNPKAALVYEMVKAGTKLGVSVGVIVLNSEQQPDGRNVLQNVLPLEVSVVGIPANPEAQTIGAKSRPA